MPRPRFPEQRGKGSGGIWAVDKNWEGELPGEVSRLGCLGWRKQLLQLLSGPPALQKNTGTTHVLGVDVRCGTPILDVKNWLRRRGPDQVELSAFAQDAKYWVDLKTVCQGPVICDREEFSYNITLEAVHAALSKMGRVSCVFSIPFTMPNGQEEIIESLLPAAFSDEERRELVDRMCCQEFLLFVEKA